jgi:hypothetical protein
MAPFSIRPYPALLSVAVAPLLTPRVLVRVILAPAAIVALEATEIPPDPKAALFPATTVPALSVVPPE